MTRHMTGTREEWLLARLAAQGGERINAAQRRARAAAAATTVGSDRQAVSIRDRRGDRLVDRPLPRALAAPRLSLHVRPGLLGRMPSCSAIADGFNGFTLHLANHDVMLWAVSRAPLAKLQAFKQRMGWTFPWASSSDSDFNSDFNIYATEEQQRAGAYEYNFRGGTPVAKFDSLHSDRLHLGVRSGRKRICG
jgi:peroxiredoxin